MSARKRTLYAAIWSNSNLTTTSNDALGELAQFKTFKGKLYTLKMCAWRALAIYNIEVDDECDFDAVSKTT